MTPFKFPATFLSLDVKERKKVPSTRNRELGTYRLLAANAIHYTTATACESMQIEYYTIGHFTLADLPPESFQDLLSRPWGQAGCQNKPKTSRNSNF